MAAGELSELKAGDIMLPADKVITISPDEKVALADLIMTRSSVGSLPVVEGDRILGIVTQRDIMLAKTFQVGSLPVRDLMTKRLIVVDRDTPLKEVLGLMIKNRIERLPVVENGKFLGLIVHGRILKELYRRL
ncbi:CBS domain-containing protein [Candidatus Pyrohabitans sp.]